MVQADAETVPQLLAHIQAEPRLKVPWFSEGHWCVSVHMCGSRHG